MKTYVKHLQVILTHRKHVPPSTTIVTPSKEPCTHIYVIILHILFVRNQQIKKYKFIFVGYTWKHIII
jgi:hypothetical protein